MSKYNDRVQHVKRVALSPVSGDAAAHEVVGEIIDLDGFDSCEFCLLLGTIAAGGSATWKIYEDEAPAMGGETEATAAIGALDIACHAVADTDSKQQYCVSYIGNMRYVRMKLTTVGAFAKDYAGVVVLGHYRNNVLNPPAPTP